MEKSNSTGKVILTHLYGHRRTQVPHQLCRRLGLKDGDILIWEIVGDKEAKVAKAKIEKDLARF